MEIDINRVTNNCMKAINDKIKNLKQLNIIVAGKTGVGKSTLINSIFRERLAETGIGRPVTQHMQRISKQDFPLAIYDTKGLELGRQEQSTVKSEIMHLIKQGVTSRDPNKMIHCIWYCINTSSDRIEEGEMEWLRNFTEENTETNVPVIIVLTKAFAKKNAERLRSYIDSLNLHVKQIVPVLARDYEVDEDYVVKAYGADTLIQVMGDMLDKDLSATLQNVQIASLEQKVKYARGIVATTVSASFAEGFAPVPFADAALLIPTQITMIASITAVFGMEVNKSIITAFVSAALGTTGATIAGRTIASNLLKLVPGVGSAAGGVIAGGTAALVTTALGEAYIKLLTAISKGELKQSDLKGRAAKELMKKLIREQSH